MSDGIPARRLLTAALKQMLMDATGRPVEVNRAPFQNNDTKIVADVPYAIIYPLPGGGSVAGSQLYHPDEDMVFVYQVTSVALRDDQADWMGDKVRWAMLGRDGQGAFRWALTPSGMTITDRRLSGAAGGLDLVDQIYQVPESYSIYVTTT